VGQNGLSGDPLLFMHIHKCAGNSFAEVLRIAAGERFVGRGTWPATPRCDGLSAGAVVGGDFIWGEHEKLGCAPRYAVALRDPISRACPIIGGQRT
jgi:hypothetical protein